MERRLHLEWGGIGTWYAPGLLNIVLVRQDHHEGDHRDKTADGKPMVSTCVGILFELILPSVGGLLVLSHYLPAVPWDEHCIGSSSTIMIGRSRQLSNNRMFLEASCHFPVL